MFKIIASLLAGYGLFLVGLKRFTNLLNQATSEGFENFLKKATKHPILNAIAGIAVGIFTVGNIVLSGCVAGAAHSLKVINRNKALTLVNYSRVGSCLYVFLAGFNLNIAILCALGVFGISYGMQKPKKWQNFVPLFFYLGLVLYGIQLIKVSADTLDDNPVMAQLISYTQVYPILAVLAGIIIMFLSQSFFASMVICISFVGSEVFTVEEAILCTTGIYLALALTRYLYLFAFEKSFKMTMSFIPYYYFLSSFLILVLYLLQDSPLSVEKALLYVLGNLDPKTQIACINFLVHIIATAILQQWIPSFSKRFPSFEFSEPPSSAFSRQLIQYPSFSVNYLQQEFIESLVDIKAMLQNLFTSSQKSQKKPRVDALYESNQKKLKDLENTLKKLSKDQAQEKIRSELLLQAEKLSLLYLLNENSLQFCTLSRDVRKNLQEAKLISQVEDMGHAMDVLLSCTIDVFKKPTLQNLYILRKVSQDRTNTLFNRERELSENVTKQSYFDVVKLFQVFNSFLWLLNQLEQKCSFEKQELKDS